MKNQLRLAKPNEIKKWDELLTKNPYGADPYQTKAFASIKANQGWSSEYWIYETSFGLVYATALVRKIRGLGRVVYITRGPSVTEPKQWSEICTINRHSLHDVIAIKMEPPILKTDLSTIRDDLVKVSDIQGSLTNTVIVDLDRGDDEIIESFRQRARRSIRGGQREQIKISEGAFSPKNVDLMWELYRETAIRAGLRTRAKSYYETFWREYSDRDQGKFMFAWMPNDDKPIAGLFVCHTSDIAIYKDGGSRRDTKAHFSHLLQWETMLLMKKKGVRRYDLAGTPPSNRLNDPSERLSTLATFKLSFGAPVTDHVGAYDQILKPKAYRKWRLVERLWQKALGLTGNRNIY